MKPGTILGFGVWFAVPGFLLGILTGVILTLRSDQGWQALVIFAAVQYAFVVSVIAATRRIQARPEDKL